MIRRGDASKTQALFRCIGLVYLCLCSLVAGAFGPHIDPQHPWLDPWSMMEHEHGHEAEDHHDHEDDMALAVSAHGSTAETSSLQMLAQLLPASLAVSPLLPPPKTA